MVKTLAGTTVGRVAALYSFNEAFVWINDVLWRLILSTGVFSGTGAAVDTATTYYTSSDCTGTAFNSPTGTTAVNQGTSQGYVARATTVVWSDVQSRLRYQSGVPICSSFSSASTSPLVAYEVAAVPATVGMTYIDVQS